MSFRESYVYDGDDEREIPACRVIVKPGDTFEVTDEAVARGLEGQSMFRKVEKAKPTKDKDKES